MPKVSVIVPVYKVEKYLNRCVDSLLAQTLDDIQIILVDDGSPDRSGEICDAYACKPGGGGGGILVIHKENGGLSDARNKGLEVATGEYIAFVDADDEVDDPNAFEILYTKARERNADLVICGCKVQNESKTFIPILPTEKDVFLEKNDFYDWLAKFLIVKDAKSIIRPAWNKLYKKSLIKDSKFILQSQVEDALFNLEIYEKCENVLLTSFATYRYYLNIGSLCRAGINAGYIDWRVRYVNAMYEFFRCNNLMMYRKYLDEWGAKMTSERICEAVDHLQPDDIVCDKISASVKKEYFPYVLTSLTILVFMFFFWIGQPHLIWKIQKIRGKMKK